MKPIDEYSLLLKKPWGDFVDEINKHSGILTNAYKYVNQYLVQPSQKILSAEDIDLMISLLEHNNIIFYKDANYLHYQNISRFLLENLNSLDITIFQRHRFFLVAVYSDYINTGLFTHEAYEENLLKALDYFLTFPKYHYDLLGLIHISQFYLFAGNMKQNKKYLEDAAHISKNCNNINYKLFFLYHFTWSAYEDGYYKESLERVNSAIKLTRSETPISLNLLNIKASIMTKLSYYEQSIAIAELTCKSAKKVFSVENYGVVAETTLTIAKNYNALKKYKLALEKALHAIDLLNSVFGGESIDPSQANAMSVAGDSFVGLNKIKEGRFLYKKALNIYKNLYKDNWKSMLEVRELIKKAY